MRLLSITVRNYRIHRDLTVAFDPARTVIGGPNESGKSTLIEAAHRALFLKAKITGSAQSTMVSKTGSGHPEVELRFEAGGLTYRIAKRFSGTSGSATLTREGSGESWTQDEAEARLTGILQVEDIKGGRGAIDRAASQWGHLWVWQGRGGDNPASHADDQRDSLLAHLKEEGGAVVMESELDRRVAGGFAKAMDALFVGRGTPRANSELDKAIKAFEAAEAGWLAARDQASRLEQAVKDFTTADRTVREKSGELTELAKAKADTEGRLGQARQLKHQAELQEKDLAQSVAVHEALLKADQEILVVGEDIRQAESSLAPEEESIAQMEQDVAGRKRLSNAAVDACRRLEADLRMARARLDLAKAWRDKFATEAQQGRLEEAAKQVAELRKTRQELQSELARLAEIDKKALTSLQALDTSLAQSRIALDAMAAGITLECSDLPVKVSGGHLAVGERRVITEDAEVLVGEGTRLRVSPGGGASLAEMRLKVEKHQQELRLALDRFGVRSVEAATRIHDQRQNLEERLRTNQTELTAREAVTIDDQLAEATAARDAALAEVERRTASVDGDWSPPKNSESAQQLVAAQNEAVEDMSQRETSFRAEQKACETAWHEADEALRKKRQSIEASRAGLGRLRMRHSTLEENHGDATRRRERLRDLAAARKDWETGLATTREALGRLLPETLEADLDRYQRAIEKTRGAISAAEQQKAGARSLLIRDGSADPAETLALAEAACEAARRHRGHVERKANAIRKLAEMFAAEQRQLAHQFTSPLADKVSGYLRQLFGSEASVGIVLTEGRFEKPVLSRSGTAFDFDTLSGGTREQVAAAFRLAMAEILAADHDGSLPIVFDDAFTHSDPERVRTLQRMLDLAARRGLQVILLTCDPSAYSGLGAATVTLG